MPVRPCVRVSSVHSVRGSPVQLGTLDTAHLLSPGRPAPSTVKLQRFLSLFVKLSLSSSSAVLSHNTQPSAVSVCPVVSHQFPHYSATYGWYQICIYAILRDFPISTGSFSKDVFSQEAKYQVFLGVFLMFLAFFHFGTFKPYIQEKSWKISSSKKVKISGFAQNGIFSDDWFFGFLSITPLKIIKL